jgi:Leucine-rich repeat (LRR) protein
VKKLPNKLPNINIFKRFSVRFDQTIRVRDPEISPRDLELPAAESQSPDLITTLENWINEAPEKEIKARVSARREILNAYMKQKAVLDLGDLELTTLPRGVLNYLTELSVIKLECNKLTMLPADLFSGLTELKAINLSNNKLTMLPADLFNGLPKLKAINLSNNQLTMLPDKIFKGLISVKRLSLHNNQLTKVPQGIYDDLIDLLYLNLSGNQFSKQTENQIRELFKNSGVEVSIRKDLIVSYTTSA